MVVTILFYAVFGICIWYAFVYLSPYLTMPPRAAGVAAEY